MLVLSDVQQEIPQGWRLWRWLRRQRNPFCCPHNPAGLWSSCKTNECLKPDKILTKCTPAKVWENALCSGTAWLVLHQINIWLVLAFSFHFCALWLTVLSFFELCLTLKWVGISIKLGWILNKWFNYKRKLRILGSNPDSCLSSQSYVDNEGFLHFTLRWSHCLSVPNTINVKMQTTLKNISISGTDLSCWNIWDLPSRAKFTTSDLCTKSGQIRVHKSEKFPHNWFPAGQCE